MQTPKTKPRGLRGLDADARATRKGEYLWRHFLFCLAALVQGSTPGAGSRTNNSIPTVGSCENSRVVPVRCLYRRGKFTKCTHSHVGTWASGLWQLLLLLLLLLLTYCHCFAGSTLAPASLSTASSRPISERSAAPSVALASIAAACSKNASLSAASSRPISERSAAPSAPLASLTVSDCSCGALQSVKLRASSHAATQQHRSAQPPIARSPNEAQLPPHRLPRSPMHALQLHRSAHRSVQPPAARFPNEAQLPSHCSQLTEH